MAKKTYVLDTNVYLTNAASISSFGNNDIVIPLKILDEIDKHKKRQDSVGAHARETIRKLDYFRTKGNLAKGVRMGKGMGIVKVRSYNPLILPDDLDLEDSDNQILATALSEQQDNAPRKVIVVSRDINMRVKCDALGLQSEDYYAEQVLESSEGLYSGRCEILVDEQVIDNFYSDEEVFLEEEQYSVLFPNQFVMLISNSNDKKTALAKFKNNLSPLQKIMKSSKTTWGTNPRNKEQQFAVDLLMDQSIPVVSLVGKAGSGKTLLALAAGLEQTFGGSENKYKKIVVTKPVEPVGKDIGFLPGTMEDKMLPWLAPIQDNLQFLMGDDKATLELYMEKGKIEVEAMTFIRGRSISNAFIVIDEVQNMTQHEIKTVLTRVGENTKIVLTGDIEQIDNMYIDETNNGLSYVVERLKGEQITGHMTLLKGERSQVASIAATKL